MTSMHPKHTIARLLAGRNRLSRLEKDDIFANVMDEIAPRKRLAGRLAPALALASVVAVLLLYVRVNNHGESTDSSFGSKGQSFASGAFSVVCKAEDGCQSGDKLVFDLSASAGYSHFAAFAKRADGVVIWYFPESENDESLALDGRLRDGVLDRGVVLGDDHQPGRYQVYGIFSTEPLTQAQIKEGFREETPDIGTGTAVVAKEFVVQ